MDSSASSHAGDAGEAWAAFEQAVALVLCCYIEALSFSRGLGISVVVDAYYRQTCVKKKMCNKLGMPTYSHKM